ncbi:MAG: VWA domain-containing protein [Acidobacteriota bacterium]|nr:VWA domain-containing protein [Acidobacteriota bacterium]
MKKVLVGLLFVLGIFSVFARAQSGRRPTPAPTPTPTAETPEDEYSESKPKKTFPVYTNPRREKAKKKEAKNTPAAAAEPTAAPAPPTDDGEDVLKIETNLVTIPVSVFDRNGLYIPNLRRTDFKIFDNGAEQEIAYFGTSDKPFTVVLLIDTSPSTAYKIEEIQQAATAFVDQLKPQDSVMVIEFDGSVHVLAEATNDRQAIYKGIKRADFGSGTSLYDAVDFSLNKRLNKIEGRKAIVLFTDGVDTASRKARYETTINDAEEADTLIFPIYYNTFFNNPLGGGGNFPNVNGGIIFGGGGNRGNGTSSAEYALGRKYLEDLADATGGRVFRPEATPGGLTTAFEGIAEELRRQYNIGFYPSDEVSIGQKRQIKVRVNRPQIIVRARESYTVGANGAPQLQPQK